MLSFPSSLAMVCKNGKGGKGGKGKTRARHERRSSARAAKRESAQKLLCKLLRAASAVQNRWMKVGRTMDAEQARELGALAREIRAVCELLPVAGQQVEQFCSFNYPLSRVAEGLIALVIALEHYDVPLLGVADTLYSRALAFAKTVRKHHKRT